MTAPALYVLSTDPARRPIAFVSEPEPCRHNTAVDVGVAKWCADCGALARWYLAVGGSELRWQMPGMAR